MHQNTPNYDPNIHFGPPWLLGGALGGQNLDLALVGFFFAPNQKVQKTKYVLICPINTPPPLVSQNFEIDTLSTPSDYNKFI